MFKKTRNLASKQKAVIDSVRKIKRIPLREKLDILVVVPKFLRLLIALSKSNKPEAGLKFVIVGAIVVIGGIVTLQISGVGPLAHTGLGALIGSTLAAWWGGLVGGPVEGFFTMLGGGAAGGALGFFLGGAIAICLIIIVVLVTFSLCIRAMESAEIEALAVEMFGEREGKSLIERLAYYSNRLAKVIEPVTSSFQTLLVMVAKRYNRKKKADSLDDIQAKVETNMPEVAEKVEKRERRRWFHWRKRQTETPSGEQSPPAYPEGRADAPSGSAEG
jgi:hypothetical protein